MPLKKNKDHIKRKPAAHSKGSRGKLNKTSLKAWPRNWLLRHLQVALSSLGRLTRAPVATLMTTMVIGIAVALPAGMWVMLENLKAISGSWDGGASISVFLNTDVTDDSISRLATELENQPAVSHIEMITRDDALIEFQQFSGFGRAIEVLQENPLPAVIIVTPAPEYSDPMQAEQLLKTLESRPEVDFAQLDLEWVERFQAITQIAIRAVVVLATLLSLAVLLIIGNTIRLEIQNRQAEIEITKLIGATNAFIRRPFLYIGFWYGFLGGVIAWFLVTISLCLLSGPIERLTGLYQSEFRLDLLGGSTTLVVLLGTALLGLTGALLAVSRHLHQIEPE